MSSALKPVLPPTGAQTSTANPPSVVGKPLTGAQGMAQHAGAPGPFSTGPLSHVPQNLGGLPHSHGNMGLPSTNLAANISMNTVSNMSQMGGHGAMNQTPPHNIQGAHTSPIKSSALPPTAAASAATAATAGAAQGRPTPHSYLSGGSAPPGPPQEEGTTLPPSQNSAQLMAVHRAQQQQNQQHNQNHPDQQPQQTTPDRFKPQPNQQPPQASQQSVPSPAQQHPSGQSPQTPQLQPQQPLNPQHTPVQSNGTVSVSTDSTNNKITVPTPPAVEAKTESTSPAAPAVQNHVTPSSNEHDVNNAKQPENSTSTVLPTGNASVPPQTQAATNSEQKPAAATTPTAEPATETPQQAAATPTKAAVVLKEAPAKPPSTMKLATTPRTTSRKREMKKVSESPKSTISSPTKTPDGKSPGAQNNRPPDKAKIPRTPSEERKSKRTRTRTQPYQSPIPELALISKLSSTVASPSKAQDEKLIVFYKNEFLAVRNAEGGFYVCQAVQNVYKSSLRIRIRWLSQDKQDKIYIPDFYDTTDFDCILTNLNMERVEKGKYNLPKDELERTENILKRALAVESGEATPSLTEEHPDGLDLSLFNDESQLKKKRKSLKRKSSEPSSSDSSPNNKRTRKTLDKSKLRKVSKSPAPRAAVKRNNQIVDRKSMSNSNSYGSIVDKKDGASKTARRSDGGRAERAKRRGESATPIVIKTSPVVDQKKARVLAKVAMKTAISASTPAQNKKKAGRNTPTGNGKAAPASSTPVKAGIKSTRSTASASNTPMAVTASASTSSTRRGKKTKK